MMGEPRPTLPLMPMPPIAPMAPRPRNRLPVWLAAALVLVWLVIHHLGISFETLGYGLADMGEYLGRYGKPDCSELPSYLGLMGITLATALWGTAFALVLAFFLAPLAARNLSPHPLIYRVTRELLNVMRAMPDLLLALFFVAALGLGPMPGALAMGVPTAGFLAKFFAESLEAVDPGIYEGLAATGANLPQMVMYAGWPSILREALGHLLYILDRNVRMASVLGLVGAGGIGAALHVSLSLFEYGRSATLILVILVTILMVDYASAWLRRSLT